MARTFQVNLNDGLYRGETATPEQIVADHPFCMGIWFKSVSTTTQKTLLWYGNVVNDYNIELRMGKATGYVFCRDTGIVPEISVVGATNVADGVWHYALVNTWTTGSDPNITYNIELYVDGSYIGTSSRIDTILANTPVNADRYAIGRWMNNVPGFSWGGQLAEAIFGKRRVTANEVMALYRGCNPIRILGTDLVRYHPLWGYLNSGNYVTADGNNHFGVNAQLTKVGSGNIVGANNPPIISWTFKKPFMYNEYNPHGNFPIDEQISDEELIVSY